MELDLNHIQAYCPYCGNKLTIELEKLNDVLIEKEKTKQKQWETERIIFSEKSETERVKISSKAEKTNAFLNFFLGIIKFIFKTISIIVVAALIFLVVWLVLYAIKGV